VDRVDAGPEGWPLGCDLGVELGKTVDRADGCLDSGRDMNTAQYVALKADRTNRGLTTTIIPGIRVKDD
jgi:hypothetical protein